MDKKILILLTGKDKNNRILKKISSSEIKEVFLCPVDFNAVKVAEQLKSYLKEKTTITAELVDFVDKFNKKAFELKTNYINFIHEIGEKEFINGVNLKRYFIYPSDNFTVWWLSLILEKCPYKTNSFTLFTKILTILQLKNELKCEQIWLTKNTSPIHNILCNLKLNKNIISLLRYKKNIYLLSEIKTIFIETLRVTKFILVLIKKIINVKKFKFSYKNLKEYLKDCDMAIVTAFPFVDQEKLKKNKFVNIFYGALQDALESNHNKKIIWLGSYTSVNSSTWGRALKIAKKVKEIKIFFMLEEWLNLKDFCRIFLAYIRLSWRCVRNLTKYKTLFVYHDAVTNLELNFWEIFRKDFLSSFLGKNLIWGITDYVIFSNMVKNLPPNTKVLHFAELHSWEKVLSIACAKRKDIICIGIQHTIVPLLFLNYFDRPIDLQGDNFIKYVPKPDYLACVGNVTRDIFLESGWPKEKLFILGAFRFQDLNHNKDVLSFRKTKKNQIVVPFSISPIENSEMLLFLYHAFNEKNIDFKILLKGHPCDPIEKTAKKLKLNINKEIFSFTDKKLNEIVSESKAMIVKESSSVFWAIVNRIPIIVPQLYNIIDLCSLTGIEGNPTLYVKSPKELFILVNDILQNKINFDTSGYQKFLDRYLEIYDDNKKYYLNLEYIFYHSCPN